ncbi:MAG: sulfatase-like hydrolase/transferase [Bdellovibrio sp.]|nr:sulfatase-like hydrolase/transferase [Bdellovibrio sp.]
MRTLTPEQVSSQIDNPDFHRDFLSKLQVRNLSQVDISTGISRGGLPLQYLGKKQVQSLNSKEVGANIGNASFRRDFLAQDQVIALSLDSLRLGVKHGDFPLKHLSDAQRKWLTQAQGEGGGVKSSYLIERLGEIRQKPDFGAIEKFVQSTTFSSSKKPNIYFVFFDTLRPDLALQYGDTFKSFYEDNYSFQRAYGAGNATVYSTFSLFHAVPASVTYHSVPDKLDDVRKYGSGYLKILKKLGYQINVYGYYWGCVSRSEPTGYGWERFLTSFFGWNASLIDRCSRDLELDKKFDKDQDEITVDEMERILPKTITEDHGRFTVISLYNNHNPYKWGALARVDPSYGPKIMTSEKGHIRGYRQSVQSSELNFKRVLNLIKSLPGGEDSIVVLFSDHGECLKEHGGEVGHGGTPFKERIRTILSFHFGKRSNFHGVQSDDHFASTTDIFPTLFDFLDIQPAMKGPWISGRSLISGVRTSVVSAQASQSNPTRKMILENKKYKAWINVDEGDFYHSSSFKFEKLTDPNDNPIPDANNICLSKSDDECRKTLMSEFHDAIEDIYPHAAR